MVVEGDHKDLVVTIYKEGAPEVKKQLQVRVYYDHAQSGWKLLMHAIERALEIEDVEGIFEEYMMFPVHRMMTLKDGGIYVVRPTADCALLRALVDDKSQEKFPGHGFIEDMRKAKEDLHQQDKAWDSPVPSVREPPGLDSLALPIDQFEGKYLTIYNREEEEEGPDDLNQAKEHAEDDDLLHEIMDNDDIAYLMGLLHRELSVLNTDDRDNNKESAVPSTKGAVVYDSDGSDVEDKEAPVVPLCRLDRNAKLLRLILMKLASLLAGDPFMRAKFFTDQHAHSIISVLACKGKDDPYVCQYALWIITQFATRPGFQEHVAIQGMKLFLQCIVEYWPANVNVLVRATIALYACIRLNTMLRRQNVEEVAGPVIKVMQEHPDHAKLNLWGCYLLLEFVSCAKGVTFLATRDTVLHLQAVLTRFYDDEAVRQAASQVLEVLVKEQENDWRETLRLGTAKGALT